MKKADISAYKAPARALHWIMAVLILAMLFSGVYFASISTPDRHFLIMLHRSMGIAILVLGITRLAYRLINPPPPPSAVEPKWRRIAAESTHILFYVLIFAMPLIGWAMQSAAGYPIFVFGELWLPSIAPLSGDLHAVLREAHRFCGYALYGLFLIHLAAALFHGWVLQDSSLQRMRLR